MDRHPRAAGLRRAGGCVADPRPLAARHGAGRRGVAPVGPARAALAGPDRSAPSAAAAARWRRCARSWSPLVAVLVFGGLFASGDAIVGSWLGSVLPDVRGSLLLRLFVLLAVGGTVLAASYLALNPPTVDPCASTTTRAAPLRVARARAAGRRGVRAVPGRPGRGGLRRPRLRTPGHRADLRRLRPPGLRPADPGHPADAAGGVGGGAQGRARRRPTAGGCAGRSARCAC